MGHAFFVPPDRGFIVWQRKDELAAMKLVPKPMGAGADRC